MALHEPSVALRDAAWQRIERGDAPPVLIVGAGINGAAVFRDLALQGVPALLVDRGDIAAGASSAPSRMIHGGLRYLETAEVGLVRESTYERNLLLRNAAHLVRPLRTVVPLYSTFGGVLGAVRKLVRRPARSGHRGAALVRVGLSLYDWLGSRESVLPGHRMLDREAALREMPGLSPRVRGAAEYWDAWITHPERLNLELVLDGLRAEPRSMVLPYVSLEADEGRDRPFVGDIVLRDQLTARSLRITPKLVVNAAGAWIDRVNRHLGIERHLIGGTKGSHLVVDHPPLREALNGAMLYFESADGRTCLVYPFLDHVLLGTTDIRVDDPDPVRCEEAEIDYLFDVLAEVLPGIRLDRSHVRYRYSGVRPLPYVDVASPGMIPRSHRIEVDEGSGARSFPVLSLVGGKWTTFRGFGEEATDVVLRRLGATRRSRTASVAIGGGLGHPAEGAERAAWVEAVAHETGVAPARVATLLERYGTRARDAAIAIGAVDDRPLRALPDHSRGEIAWIVREELVTRLEDLVLRRTLIAIRGMASDAVVRELGAVAGEALGWSAQRIHEEVDETLARLRSVHGVGRAPSSGKFAAV